MKNVKDLFIENYFLIISAVFSILFILQLIFIKRAIQGGDWTTIVRAIVFAFFYLFIALYFYITHRNMRAKPEIDLDEETEKVLKEIRREKGS